MWLLLLLAARAAGEWVEISQHHRRAEPSRRHPAHPPRAVEPNKVYANYSLTERSWHKSGPRITNVGSVRRVQLQDNDELTFSVGGSENSRMKTTAIDRRYESIGSVKAPNLNKENVEADKVKRKPTLNRFGTVNVTDVSIHNPFTIGKTIVERPKLFDSSKLNKNNKYQEILINDDEYNNDESETIYNSLEMNPDIKNVQNESKIGISTKIRFANKPLINVKQYTEENAHNFRSKSVGTSSYSDATNKTTNDENWSSPAYTLYPSTPAVGHSTQDCYNKTLEVNMNNPTEIPKSQQRIKDKTGNDDYTDPNLAERKRVNSDGGTKTDAIQVIWKLMKIVTDNISRNTRRSFRSKVRYLEDLQNNIVANIAERIDSAWPDDVAVEAEARGARRKRDAEARGHVEFPSSESALMTISFLTFAVFLIKLVLQVIHTYKNKTMMVTPAVVAAVGRAAASLNKQTQP